jgi:hypothetical protein
MFMHKSFPVKIDNKRMAKTRILISHHCQVEKKRKTVNTRRVISAAELVVGGVITKLQSNSIVADWI